jgi:uncharacterized protein YjbI with pentapeptide repeats
MSEDKNMTTELRITKHDVMEYVAEHRDAMQPGKHSLASGSLSKWMEGTGRGEGTARIVGGNFRGLDLSGADFSGVRFENCTFEGATLNGVNFSGAVMRKNCLIGIKSNAVNFSGADLHKANLGGAKLLGIRRPHEDDNEINFTGATLTEANLAQAHLRNAYFTSAEMTDAILSETELENVSFRHANMVGVDLTGSKPQFRSAMARGGADNAGVQLQGAVVIDAKGLETYEGHMDQAIDSVAELATVVQRAARMAEGGEMKDFIRRQAEARRGAAEAVLERGGHSKTQDLEAALESLNKALPKRGGFAEVVIAGRQSGERGRG